MEKESTSLTARIALGSLAVGVAVLALKVLAAWLTGSIALYSDALESVVNVVTAVVALVAVRLAARPADAGPALWLLQGRVFLRRHHRRLHRGRRAS